MDHVTTMNQPRDYLWVALIAAAAGCERDIGVRGMLQDSALQRAAAGEDVGEVQSLLRRGADVHHQDAYGRTALHRAVVHGPGFGEPADCRRIVELLLAQGAKINAPDHSGRTPLHTAIEWSRDEQATMVELLLSRGASATAKDHDGQIPLHLAARKGCTKIAEILLGRGVDVNAKDSFGYPPLYLAEDAGHKELAELLKKHGGVE